MVRIAGKDADALGREAHHSAELVSDNSEAAVKENCWAVMRTVYDPEIPVDVWELGLIYDLKIFPVNNVFVEMTLTSPSCPSAGTIPVEIEQKIREVEGVNDVSVELTWDPPYSQDMMSEEAKLELGFM
jgi:FeS assembly SUF system protein